jgi:primase-polymerase (primpol)-like protein
MTLSTTAPTHDHAPKQEYLSHIQEPQHQHIPLQLRTGKRHLVWIPEQRGDTIAKTPYNARALLQSEQYFKASATNERSWSSFPQAVKACQQHRNVGGIGRALADGIMQIV